MERALTKRPPGRPRGSTSPRIIMEKLARSYRQDPTMMGLGDIEDGVPIDVYDNGGWVDTRTNRNFLRERMSRMVTGQSFLAFGWHAANRVRQHAWREGISIAIRKDLALGLPDVWRIWRIPNGQEDLIAQGFAKRKWARAKKSDYIKPSGMVGSQPVKKVEKEVETPVPEVAPMVVDADVNLNALMPTTVYNEGAPLVEIDRGDDPTDDLCIV